MGCRFVLICAIVALSGCGEEAASAAEPADSAGTASPEPFESGRFQLFVEAVEDECLDGSLALVFMPSGTAEPYALQNMTWIPGESDLPDTYVMDLEAPFSDMSMTVTAGGEGTMRIRDALQPDVVLGQPGTGDCAADMRIDADFTVLDPDTLRIVATVTLESFESAEEMCPESAPPPCTVRLTMRGERQ